MYHALHVKGLLKMIVKNAQRQDIYLEIQNASAPKVISNTVRDGSYANVLKNIFSKIKIVIFFILECDSSCTNCDGLDSEENSIALCNCKSGYFQKGAACAACHNTC